MPFSLDNHDLRVTNTVLPEELRNIVVLIFRELVMRLTGARVERTGFETATNEELHLALYRAVDGSQDIHLYTRLVRST